MTSRKLMRNPQWLAERIWEDDGGRRGPDKAIGPIDVFVDFDPICPEWPDFPDNPQDSREKVSKRG